MVTFEGYERRIDKINACLKEYGIADLEEARNICLSKNVDPDAIVRGVQNICFENAVWAYTLGCAIAIKKNCVKAANAAEAIGIGLQAFCIPGSVAENRKVASATETLRLNFFVKKPNVSRSSPVTNPLRLRKAQSVLQEVRTK